MPGLDDLQRRFAAALANPALEAPAGTPRRFGVHRNNVRAGMCAVLEARFPAVRRLVGDQFFAAMAQLYAAKDPPRSPILLLYGVGFPGFIATFEPAADVPYLADIARLEWLQHEATNAADATSIGATDLSAVPAEKVADLRLRLHLSLRLFASPFPALTIWELNSRPGDVAARKLAATPEYALLLRPALTVEVRRVPADFHAFVAALRDRETLAAAVAVAASFDVNFDFQHAFAGLVAMGAVTGYELP